MAKETVILAKLKRGKSYKVNHDGEFIEFKRNIPKEVPEDLADMLEELTDEVAVDGTDDKVELDIFEIERDAVPLARRHEGETRRRKRLVTEEVPVKRAVRPKLRKPPTGFKRKA